jgi:flagellar motility protein MotE (MotC chaperone)
MRSKAAGKILSRLDVKTAKNISEKMAGQKKKPGAKKGGN